MASTDADILSRLDDLALTAGRAIMEVYARGATVEHKADDSPVTEADRRAEEIILEGLRSQWPDVPCVAEEEVSSGRIPPTLGSEFFLVDPLDGTKEFIARRGDFTVNIALIRDGAPAIGVVYAPAQGKIFSGRPGLATEAAVDSDHRAGERREINARYSGANRRIVASRSHRTAETDEFIAKHPGAEIVSVGSSLKFCLLARGEADLYPRFGRTMEWDTAAGDAVLRAAGGSTVNIGGTPFVYGKREQAQDVDFANPWFIAEAAKN
ncbi:MAG: 3'(2'),5'-bisphosphate nucleotidase CysQ [Mesorhizobium sp.]